MAALRRGTPSAGLTGKARNRTAAGIMPDTQYVAFPGRLVIVGFGSIGQGVLPLILRHIDISPSRITIVTAEELGHDEADRYGIRFVNDPLTRDNYRAVLTPLLGPSDFLLNVSVDVS